MLENETVPYSTGSQQNSKIPVLFEMNLGSHRYPSTGSNPILTIASLSTCALVVKGDWTLRAAAMVSTGSIIWKTKAEYKQ